MNTILPKSYLRVLTGLLLLLPPFFQGCQEASTLVVESRQEQSAPSALVVSPESHGELSRIFALNNYDLDTLEEGVPKLIVQSLPQDLENISQTSERKRLFFLTLLPMVLMGNEEIQAERDLIESVLLAHDQGRMPSAGLMERLADLQVKYKVKGDLFEDRAVREALLKRVDILPPSLVLAQAANESAWGTSRFAKLANNLFGEWTFTPGTGIVPEKRPEGQSYEVRSFPTIYDSLQSYMLNLNTHRAYAQLRETRARLRLEERPLRGVELAQGLTAYSTRREAYVAEIAAMIRHNKLTRFSEISLRGS
ncbi:glucosaminidase domain-containing protein [Geoalkalibacter sp.]|uniref:glucosaminidase domain-containing protein n=1 Tax=Geoalkalibacter sp. TaxID=3041440 RepID=UPI00272EB19C|nr:glucosaminidase domain-containing protein [Geoalkalibacter sp.]